MHPILTLFALNAQRFLKVLHLNALHVMDILDVCLRLRTDNRHSHITRHPHQLLIPFAFFVHINRGDVERTNLNAKRLQKPRSERSLRELRQVVGTACELLQRDLEVHGHIGQDRLYATRNRVFYLRPKILNTELVKSVQLDEPPVIGNVESNGTANGHRNGQVQIGV